MRKFRSGLICLGFLLLVFGYLGYVMGVSHMLNTIMHTAHDLLLNTCFFLMAICVLMGALSRLLLDFGVVDLIGRLFKPLMKPLFNLPGEASLGAVMTFLSDNPAIITLARDRKFSKKFRTYQLISLTNFGTAFGMGLIVIVFMIGQGFVWQPLVGLFGAFVGAVVSTRLMQVFTLKEHPEYRDQRPSFQERQVEVEEEKNKENTLFVRLLNSLLDGGKSGVEVGMSIIPGVLIISTMVMLLTFGTSASGTYTGGAYEGTEFLPWLAGKINFVFDWLFGFDDPHLVAFPITALGAVGAALGVVPRFIAEGWVNGNAVAVFTAIGMCWSGYMSTHTAMLDSLGYRSLTSKAIGAHTIGGLVAGMVAHWVMVLISLF